MNVERKPQGAFQWPGTCIHMRAITCGFLPTEEISYERCSQETSALSNLARQIFTTPAGIY